MTVIGALWIIQILLGLAVIACSGMSIYHANKAIVHANKAKEILGVTGGRGSKSQTKRRSK
ncbi:MAG: hypothetical protein ACTIC1_20735 [Brevibacterium sp.]